MPGDNDEILDDNDFNPATDDSGDAGSPDHGAGDQAPDTADTPDQKPDAGTDNGAAVEDPAKASKDVKDGMLDRVKALMGLKKDKPDDAEKAAPAQPGQKTPVKTDAKANGKAAAVQPGAAEKDNAGAAQEVPPEVANHPAYRQVVAEAEQLRESAGRFQEYDNFLRSNNVSGDEADQALFLTALSRQDPEAFLQRIEAIADQYKIVLGKKLPDDLQAEVDNGYMGEEQARRVAQQRIELNRTKQERDYHREARTNEQQTQAKAARQEFIEGWFENTATTDPHLEQKADAIVGEMMRLQQKFGAPKNQDALQNLLDTAYQNVSKRMMPQRPARTPTDPVPAASGNNRRETPASLAKTNPLAATAMDILNKSRGFGS